MTTKAIVPFGSKDIALPDEFADAISDEKAATANAGSGLLPAVSLKGGIWKFNEQESVQTDIVVLETALVNLYYDTPFDAAKPSSPACYALGSPGSGDIHLKPGDDAPDMQADTCEECWANAWKSRGKGKACSNRERLTFLDANGIEEAADFNAAIAGRLTLSVTSVAPFANYVKALHARGVPVSGAITRVHIKPHPNNQYELIWEPLGVLSGEAFGVVKSRAEQARPSLTYSPIFEATEGDSEKKVDARPKRGGGRRKVTQKRVIKKKSPAKRTTRRR